MKRLLSLGILAWLLLIVPLAAASPSPSTLIVSPGGPYQSINAALVAAQDGDTIEVRGGVHPAPLVVNKRVSLIGVDWPVVDGEGKGSVVTLAAANITFQGFIVRGSGSEPDRNHAGIAVIAPDVLVENNRLEDVLFGIYVAEGSGTILRGNDITSKTQYELGRKGDSIRIWYSPNVLVEHNVIHETRDLVIWYSPDVIIQENEIRGGRYGIHLMYTDDIIIRRNRLLNNSVGIYTMYSHDVLIEENLVRGHRGPNGFALGFKDADNVTVLSNVLVDNNGGIFMDGTPFSPQGFSQIEGNILAFNDVAVTLQPAVRGNQFVGNSFWENGSQMTLQGGGRPGVNLWQGNSWSDYTGFDADGDGQGDVAYRSERFFEDLLGQEPRLRVLLYSPAVQALEMAARSFPLIQPQPKLVDESPRMAAAALPPFAHRPQPAPGKMVGAAAIFLSLALLGAITGLTTDGLDLRRFFHPAATFLPNRVLSFRDSLHKVTQATMNQQPSLAIQQVSKQYGPVHALRRVSLTAQPGQAIALWGENGAGKTTLIKAILGLISYEGSIHVLGQDGRKQGKAVRRLIGYVPQELVLSDWSVRATMQFFCRLKQANPQRIEGLLTQLGLLDHQHKPVPALSGGLRQRLALALALLDDPPILLLDEVTANLDTQARWEYLDLLAGLCQQGKTILFASHRLEEVEALADKVLLLEQGEMIGLMEVGELRPRLQHVISPTLQTRLAFHEATATNNGNGKTGDVTLRAEYHSFSPQMAQIEM
ncbi:MAG: nitrous oxide reductase family maturation protein NosD [Anaerolineae bacterium]|nr:nitrous oxide reductase family maturation protein NosD [Anaerolineae bacterium]